VSGLCGHQPLNGHDNTQTAAADDQYAARHHPFVYFHSIIDANVSCEERDVPLTQLPDVTKLPQKVLNKDEQQGKVNEMITKGQQHQTEAAKDIENGK
jgi:hypothetical protein